MKFISKKVILAFLFLVFSAQIVYGLQQSGRNYIIYSSFAYVIDSRTIQIDPGEQTILIDDLPDQIQPETLFLETVDSGIEIQHYLFDTNIFNFNRVLNDHKGEEIRLSMIDGQIVRGIFYGINGNDIILRSADSFTSISKSQIKDFTIDGIVNVPAFRPRLSITVSSSGRDTKTIRLHYLVNGIRWRGEYVGIYNPSRETMIFKSHARIENYSGKDIESSSITLVAGEPHKVMSSVRRSALPTFALKSAERAQEFQVEDTHIFHKFVIEQELVLNDNAQRQIRLSGDREIQVEQKNIFESSRYGNKVVNILEFVNSASSGTGAPIPAGTIRIYEDDGTGTLFLGEDLVRNTPVDGIVSMQTGVVFDITAQRTQKQFRRIGDRSREEEYEIVLENSGIDDKDVVVKERFVGDWRIIISTATYTQPDSRTAQFIVTVPAGSKLILTYTVRIN